MPRGTQTFGWKAVVAMSGALLLAGCAQTVAPVKTPRPSPSASGVYPSAAAAGAAAKRLYLSYLERSSKVSAAGGAGIQALEPLMTPAGYAAERKGAAAIEARGVHTSGDSKLVRIQVQRVDLGTGEMSAYACVSLDGVRVLSSAGKDVTPRSRPVRQTSLVVFEWFNHHLAIAKNGTWSGQSIC